MADEMDSLLLSLIEKEIPDGRHALLDSHKNLAVLSDYCKENYINSADKSKALDETKSYAAQSLSSVAYQIHSLAVNMLQMMDQQYIQLQNMQSDANNIGLKVDIYKEKVARKEIGKLTSSKNFSRSHKIVPPTQQEKPKKYKREEIDYSVLDGIGHGVKTDRREDFQRRASTSSSSGSVKAPSVSSVHSSSHNSLHNISQSSQSSEGKRTLNIGPVPRPPVAPVAPTKLKSDTQTPPAPPQPPPPTNIPPPPPMNNMPPPPPLTNMSPPMPAMTNMPPPPDYLPQPDYEGELDALLQSLENISFDIPYLNNSDTVPKAPPLPTLPSDDECQNSKLESSNMNEKAMKFVEESDIGSLPVPPPPPPVLCLSSTITNRDDPPENNILISPNQNFQFPVSASSPTGSLPPRSELLESPVFPPLPSPEDAFPPPFISPRELPQPPDRKLSFPDPPLQLLSTSSKEPIDESNNAQLPPPPPDMDDLYQIPTNNALADDLPPPPPNDFYEPVPPPPPMSPTDPSDEKLEEKVIAIYDYQKLRDDELELVEGDILYVIKKNDDGWFEGIKDGVQGLFPGNYVTPYM